MRLSRPNNTCVGLTRVTPVTSEGVRYFSNFRKIGKNNSVLTAPRMNKLEILTSQNQNKPLLSNHCLLLFTKPANNLFLWVLIWFKLEYNSTSRVLNFRKLNIYLFQYKRMESEPFKGKGSSGNHTESTVC